MITKADNSLIMGGSLLALAVVSEDGKDSADSQSC